MISKKIVLALLFFSTICFSQMKITGVVYNEYLEPFYNASVVGQKGSKVNTDNQGSFTIELKGKFPQTIKVSASGFNSEEVVIQSLKQEINVVLKESLTIDQVVVSASRVPERIIESPVAIQRLGRHELKKNPSNSFLDALANLNGVYLRRNSYGFQSVNTRGFSGISNSRFVQLVDGADVSTPSVIFSQGNFIGLNELDIESVEVLPGASSALYGANAYNGLMLVKTKNPFDDQGIKAQFKTGFTDQKGVKKTPIYDVSLNFGHKFNDVFAAKVNFAYQKAEDWHAKDYRSVDTWFEGSKETLDDYNRGNNPSYDGINTYGDEHNLLNLWYEGGPDYLVARTGYTEEELIEDYSNKSVKGSLSLFIRPFEDKSYEFELASAFSKSGYISQTPQDRYLVKDFMLSQTKLELRSKDFFVRGYYNKTMADQIYNLSEMGHLLNVNSGSDELWRSEYFKYFYNLGMFTSAGKIDLSKLEQVRNDVDKLTGRFNSNSNVFGSELRKVKKSLITTGEGSKLYDKSDFIHADANYNFKRLLNGVVDFQIGGSHRKYSTNSKGTIFSDVKDKIVVREYGFYSQLQKKFLDDRLKLTAAFRYDKSTNFEGNYSPRFSLNYGLGQDKTHVLRFSYQTGFRNPTLQEQYFSSKSGAHLNVGSTNDNLDKLRYTVRKNRNTDFPDQKVITKDDILNGAFLTKSIWGSDLSVFSDPSEYEKSRYKQVKPETVQTLEFGYRSLVVLNSKTNLDINFSTYYSKHKDFIFYQDLTVPSYLEGLYDDDNSALVYEDYQLLYMVTNAFSKVYSYGFGVNVGTKLFSKYNFSLGYNYADYYMDDFDQTTFEPNFNTPKHTVKAQLSGESIFNNLGFGINTRWLDSHRWVSPFVKGNISSRFVVDAQVNWSIPSLKSKVKIGGNNVFGKEYYIAPGSGSVGNLYYLSWIIND